MARRLPPLNALRAFEASARLGSFVAAAAELHVSAAAVSQQVRRLERYLDTTLFQRLARGLVLTEEGRDYLPELSAGFDLLGESTARLRTQRAGGVLTLTMLAAFANGWLLPRLHRFHERASRVEVVLRTSRTLADFKRDDIDLAIRFAPGPGRGLHGELLCGEELFPVASPSLFGGGRTPDTLAALAGYPLLHDIDAHPEQPWMSWRAWFERAGLDAAAGGARHAVHRLDRVDRRGRRGARRRARPRTARRAAARARPARARHAGKLARAVELLPRRAGGAFPPTRRARVRRLGACGSARRAGERLAALTVLGDRRGLALRRAG